MRILIILLFSLLVSNSVFAEDATVEMLNKLGKENMVFSTKIVKVDVGDTVFWKAINKGHNVEFIMKGGVPEGVEKFKSKVGQDTEYTFLIPGIYAYWCTPHKAMGMIGFIIVNNDVSNIDSIQNIKYLGKSKKIAKELITQITQ
jgi:pseudoazurin|tara:strand:- start:142 stop:576 length:435 start_codon:yes stop_codon:yes gene_type:complete